MVLARFGPNLSMPIGGRKGPAAAFAYLVPALPCLRYDVVCVGSRPGDTVFTWRHDVGLNAGALDLVSPPGPIVPAGGYLGDFGILVGAFSGGPGLDEDRSLGIPNGERPFTFAP